MYVCMYSCINFYLCILRVSEYKVSFSACTYVHMYVYMCKHVYESVCMYGTFFFDASHEFLGLLVLRGHDVSHTQVGQHNRSDVQQTLLQPFHFEKGKKLTGSKDK